MDIYDKINELYDKRRAIELGGGDERIEKQHEKGKLTARERIDLLLDKDTFVELNPFVTHRTRDFGMDKQEGPGDGVVTGYGKIDGRPIYLILSRFHCFRRCTWGNARHENRKCHGFSCEKWCAFYRFK